MSRFRPSRFGWVVTLTIGLGSLTAQAQELRYRYVPLDKVKLPPGFAIFDPIALGNGGRIYGTVYPLPDLPFAPFVAVYEDGAVSVLGGPGFTYTANRGGTVGGSVLVDPENFIEQAALFHGDRVELIPRMPGEFTSFVIGLTDSGLALVVSYDKAFQSTLVLYKNGRLTRLPIDGFFLDINNRGQISGTMFLPGIGDRAFRFDTRTGETTLLHPQATEPYSWGLHINNRGDVLGYSFVIGAIERIGVWDSKGTFQTYFVEGTPQFPTVSNRLLFNDNNLIVITEANDGNSYLVPRPGVRLNLADLVENLPPGPGALWFVTDVNNHGDMIGYGFDRPFLLERIGDGDQ